MIIAPKIKRAAGESTLLVIVILFAHHDLPQQLGHKNKQNTGYKAIHRIKAEKLVPFKAWMLMNEELRKQKEAETCIKNHQKTADVAWIIKYLQLVLHSV
jgi:hypothetical protein